MQLLLPFCSKELSNGKRLFRRKHGYSFTLSANDTTTYSITVPYAACKVMDVELLWFPEGVTVDFKVKDTAAGTYSGIPNRVLDQFGFTAGVAKDYHHDVSPYDADLYVGMIIEITLNNPTDVTKTVAVNIPYHEVT